MRLKSITFAVLFILLINFFKASAAANYINSWTSDNSINSTADFSVTQAITPTIGNLLIMFIVSRQDLASQPTVTGWTFRGSRCSPSSTACIYSFSKLATGSETVSALLDNQDNPNSATITILEYGGALNTLNNSNSSFGTGTTLTTGTVTTNNTNELLVAISATDSNTNHSTWTNSFTQRVNHLITGKNLVLKAIGLDLTTNTAGTYSTGTTLNKSENWSAMIFNFATLESTTSNLQLSKTVTNTNPAVNQVFSYTISLFNSGARNNTGVQVYDSMPTGLTITGTDPSPGTSFNSSTGIWDIGNIDTGQTKTLTISAFPQAVLSGTSITNTTNISSYDVTDPSLADNTSSVTINVKQLSSAPSFNTPILEGDTVISGASLDTEGAAIYVYNGGTLIGNTTLSGGTWAANVVTVSGGSSITAKSVVAGCCESPLSNAVTVLYKTAIPVITVPIHAGTTSIKGTTSEANGTNIEVYLNNSFLGTTTSSGGNWELAIPKASLQTGYILKVRGTASGKYVSNFSSNVLVIDTVSPIPDLLSSVISGDTVLYGTSLGDDGTLIEVFKTRSGVTNSIGFAVVSGNSWILAGISESEIRLGDIFTAKARIDTNNDGFNNSSDVYSDASEGVTALLRISQVPYIDELDNGDTIISGGSVGYDGTLIKIYKNNSYFSSTTVSNNLWSISSASLVFGEEYKATATFDNDNNGVVNGSDTPSGYSSIVTVGGTPVSQVPLVNQPITAGDKVIRGQSFEDSGTIIHLFVGGVNVGSLATTTLNWNLSIPVATLQTGEVITAKATASGKSESALSTGITVISKIPPTPIVNQVKAGSTTITGSVLANGSSIVEVLVNGVQIATTSISNNTWNVTVASNELQTGEIVTARAHIDYDNDGDIELDDESSNLSPQVTVINRISPVPTLNPIGFNTKVVTGNLTPVAVTKIYVYRLRAGTRTLLGVTQTNSPSFFLDEIISNPWILGDSITATSITDTNNDGVVNDNDIQSIDSEAEVIFDDSIFQSSSEGEGGCGNIKPNGKPTIYKIEPIGDTKLKIYFNPLHHPRDKFEYEYINLQSTFKTRGEINNYILGHFEIDNLFKGNNYDIRIRAVNGCTKGEWSEFKRGYLLNLPFMDNLLNVDDKTIFSEPFKNEIFNDVFTTPFQKSFEGIKLPNSENIATNWFYYLGSFLLLISTFIGIFIYIKKRK